MNRDFFYNIHLCSLFYYYSHTKKLTRKLMFKTLFESGAGTKPKRTGLIRSRKFLESDNKFIRNRTRIGPGSLYSNN